MTENVVAGGLAVPLGVLFVWWAWKTRMSGKEGAGARAAARAVTAAMLFGFGCWALASPVETGEPWATEESTAGRLAFALFLVVFGHALVWDWERHFQRLVKAEERYGHPVLAGDARRAKSMAAYGVLCGVVGTVAFVGWAFF